MNPIDALMERLRYEFAKLGSGWPGEGRQQRIEDFRGMSPPPSVSDALAERAAYEARKAGTGFPGPGQQQRIQNFQGSGAAYPAIARSMALGGLAGAMGGLNSATPDYDADELAKQAIRNQVHTQWQAVANAPPATMADYDPELQLKLAARGALGDRNIASVGKMGTPSDTFKARIAQAQGALQPGYTRKVSGTPVGSLDAIWALGGRKYPTGSVGSSGAPQAAPEGPSISERLEALATGQGPGLAGINPEAAGKYHNQATVGPHGVKAYRRPDGRIILFGSDYYRDDPERKQFRDTAPQRQAANRQAMRDRMATRRAEAALGVSLTGATPEARQQAIVEAQQRAVQRRGMNRNERMLADRLEQLSAGAGEGGGGNLFDVIKTYQTGLAMGLSPEGAGKIAQAQYEAGLRANDPALAEQRLDRELRQQLATDELQFRREEAAADRELQRQSLRGEAIGKGIDIDVMEGRAAPPQTKALPADSTLSTPEWNQRLYDTIDIALDNPKLRDDPKAFMEEMRRLGYTRPQIERHFQMWEPNLSEQAVERFQYNPETGDLEWKPKGFGHFLKHPISSLPEGLSNLDPTWVEEQNQRMQRQNALRRLLK